MARSSPTASAWRPRPIGPPPEAAPTLVLLHEGLGCVALWREFPQKLAHATGFGVFVYSRAGYGRSDPVDLPRPLDYMTREARFSLPAVLDAIGFRRGVLVGHSDGASIAAIYRRRARRRPREGPRPDRAASLHRAARASPPSPRRSAPTRRATSRPGSPAITPMSTPLSSAGTAPGSIPASRPGPSKAFVERWRAPALVIQGTDDQYGTLAQVRAIEKRSPAPVETLVLDNCRHAPQFEQPDATLAAIAAFCRSVLRRPD